LSLVKIVKLAIVAEVAGQIDYAFELVAHLVDRLTREGDETRAAEMKAAFDRGARGYTGAVQR
jgi:hypothetical protein